jgi:hypothetical protein
LEIISAGKFLILDMVVFIIRTIICKNERKKDEITNQKNIVETCLQTEKAFSCDWLEGIFSCKRSNCIDSCNFADRVIYF